MPGARGIERFRWTIPPGARRMNMAVHGKARLWIDGRQVACPDDRVTLPAGIHGPRQALLEVETASPARSAAAFRQPITYECGKGRIALGDWRDQGLTEWSGGVAYECVIPGPANPGASRVLDLGKVRGTAEMFVNGASAGIRFTWPYRYEIGDSLVAGENHLRIEVFNTLAPLFDAISASDMIHEGQQSSGMFGPVRLLGRTREQTYGQYRPYSAAAATSAWMFSGAVPGGMAQPALRMNRPPGFH